MSKVVRWKTRLPSRMRQSLRFATAFLAACIVIEVLGVVLHFNNAPVWALTAYDALTFPLVVVVAYFSFFTPRRSTGRQ